MYTSFAIYTESLNSNASHLYRGKFNDSISTGCCNFRAQCVVCTPRREGDLSIYL